MTKWTSKNECSIQHHFSLDLGEGKAAQLVDLDPAGKYM